MLILFLFFSKFNQHEKKFMTNLSSNVANSRKGNELNQKNELLKEIATCYESRTHDKTVLKVSMLTEIESGYKFADELYFLK